MKKIFLLAISAILLISIITYVSALANPATVYCEEMNNEFGGYDYQINADENGNQYGVCVVSGEEYEEWAFLKGRVGEDDSYCVKNGYDIKIVNENGNEYAVCIVPKSRTVESGNENEKSALSSEESEEQEVPMEELMNLGEKVAERGILTSRQGISSESEEGKRLMSSFQEQKNSVGSTYNQGSYPYWDWRNPPNTTVYSSDKFTYFDNIRGWMTSIKNQASCGSCWSFSAHGSTEAKYNLEQNNSRLNPDLSEQNSVSCDHGCYGGYTWPADAGDGCQGDCSTGGYMDLALKFFMNNGTVDESCLAYTSGTTENVGVCSVRCSDYQSREWTVGNYTGTWPEGGIQLWLTNNQTKQWLIDNGPMIAGMYASELNGSDGIIERCTDDSATPNHAIVLVGFNDTGNDSTSYWIIKNSWGTGWGDDDSGYFKLGFNECNFTSEFDYATNITAPNFKSSINLNSPVNNNQITNTLVTFNFSISNRIYQNSTCDLLINNITRNTTALAINGTSTILDYNLSNGQYNWSISCWENGLGIVNSSETRGIVMDATVPIVHLIAPLNNSYSPVGINVSHSFNVTDDSGPANCTFYYTGGSHNFTDVYVNGSAFSAGNLTSSDGVVIWTVNCTDTAGNTGAGEIWNYTVDTIFPTLNFTSPNETSGATINRNNIQINITANDTNLKNITIKLYNSSRTIINTTNTTSTSLFSNFTGLTDGIYYFNATACDNAGNCNYSETRNVTIDANPPIMTINSPTNGSYYVSVLFNVTLNKNSTCWYSIDGAANKSMSSIDNRNFNATNSSMSQIAHNLTFSCNDSLNNWNFTSRMFYFDTTSPVVTLISPEDDNSAYEEDESIPFKYNVTDNFGIANCSLLIEDEIHVIDTSIVNNTIETISHSIASSGSYDWRITCYDRAGNHDDSSLWTIDIQAADDGGGSSGSSSTDDEEDPVVVYPISDTKLIEGYTRQMNIGDKLNFSINSSYHTLTLKSLKGKNATITIASTIQTITLKEGEEIKVDLTSDNYYELSVKLNNISSSAANFTLKSIYEIKPVLSSDINATGSLGSTGVVNDGWTNEKVANIKKTIFNVFSNKYVLIGIGVLVLAIIVYFGWYTRRKIRRKKGWDK